MNRLHDAQTPNTTAIIFSEAKHHVGLIDPLAGALGYEYDRIHQADIGTPGYPHRDGRPNVQAHMMQEQEAFGILEGAGLRNNEDYDVHILGGNPEDHNPHLQGVASFLAVHADRLFRWSVEPFNGDPRSNKIGSAVLMMNTPARYTNLDHARVDFFYEASVARFTRSRIVDSPMPGSSRRRITETAESHWSRPMAQMQ